MMTIRTFRGLGRDGRIQQCLVRSRYSIHVRNSFHPSVGMIENTSVLESQAFLHRLAAELEQVGLAGHTCSGQHPPRARKLGATYPHHTCTGFGLRRGIGQGALVCGFLCLAQSGTPQITIKGIMLEKERTIHQMCQNAVRPACLQRACTEGMCRAEGSFLFFFFLFERS